MFSLDLPSTGASRHVGVWDYTVLSCRSGDDIVLQLESFGDH